MLEFLKDDAHVRGSYPYAKRDTLYNGMKRVGSSTSRGENTAWIPLYAKFRSFIVYLSW